MFTEGLNKEEKRAVETLTGPLLILAGAGSGKTKTLTCRIANLLAHGIPGESILAVTFTNKAAKEMRTRLWNLLQSANLATNSDNVSNSDLITSGAFGFDENSDGFTDPPRNFMPYMGTFHGICVRILHIEHEAAGLDNNFTIYDREDQISLVKRAIKNLQIENKYLKPNNVISTISHCKNIGETPEQYGAAATYENQCDIAKIFKEYESEKQQASALDFDDLLLKTAELFEENFEVRKKWQNKLKHILIDEYQDTNHIQYRLVRALVNDDRNICVVGDDWQSIYSWRGADFTNILNFEKDFPGAKVIKLEQNYRSTQNILDAAQKVIMQNTQRSDKALFTESGKGAPVTIEALRDEEAEANWVGNQINRRGRPLSDFAVLY